MQNGTLYAGCYRIVNGERQLIHREPVAPGRIYLFIEGSEGAYHFYFGYSECNPLPLALAEDGSILSTVVADGFVGSYLGIYASSNHKESVNHADFDWFKYEIIEE